MSSVSVNYTNHASNYADFEENQNSDVSESVIDGPPKTDEKDKRVAATAEASKNTNPAHAKSAAASADVPAANEPPPLTAAQKHGQKQAQQQMFKTFAAGIVPEVQRRLSTWLPDALVGDDKTLKGIMGSLTERQRLDLNVLTRQQDSEVLFPEVMEGGKQRAKDPAFDKKGFTELQQRFGEHALKESTPGLAATTSYDTGSTIEATKEKLFDDFTKNVDPAVKKRLATWLPAAIDKPTGALSKNDPDLIALAKTHGLEGEKQLLNAVITAYKRDESLATAGELPSTVDLMLAQPYVKGVSKGMSSVVSGAAINDGVRSSVGGVTDIDVKGKFKGGIELKSDIRNERVAFHEKEGFGELDSWLPAALAGHGEIPKGDAAAMKLLGRFAENMGLQGGATATPEAAFAYLKESGVIDKALHSGSTEKEKSFLLFTDTFLDSTIKYGTRNGAMSGEMVADTANVAEMLLGPDDGGSAPRQVNIQALAAAVLHRTDQPLERQQELMAAAGYINKAETLSEQKERLQQSLLAFHVREEIGTAPMTGRQWETSYAEVNPDLYGEVSEWAFTSPTSQEMQIITAHLGVPGDHKFMVDKKRKITMSNDELGNVESFDLKKKKTKWYKQVLDIAVPVIGTVLTFVPGAQGVGIGINAAYSAYKGAEAIKNGDLLGGALAIAGGVTGGAAGYLGSAAKIAGASAATVGAANTAANVAQGVAVANGALNVHRAAEAGDILGAVTSGLGAASAGASIQGSQSVSTGLRATATGINTGRAIDSGDYLAAGAGFAGLAGDAANYNNSSAGTQYTFQGLQQSLSLADAIEDKNYAGIGGAASGLIQAGGNYQHHQQKQEELRLAQAAAQQPEQDAGRGPAALNGDGDPAIRKGDYRNGGGQAAASNIQVAPGDSLSRIAAHHGTTVDDLMAANPGITDPNRIDAGQQLTLPPGVQPASTGRQNMLRDLANANGGTPILPSPPRPGQGDPTVQPGAIHPNDGGQAGGARLVGGVGEDRLLDPDSGIAIAGTTATAIAGRGTATEFGSALASRLIGSTVGGPAGVALAAATITLVPSPTGGGREEWPVQGFDNLRFAKHGDEVLAQVEYKDAAGDWQQAGILVESGEDNRYSIAAEALAGALKDRGFTMPDAPDTSLLPGTPINPQKPSISITPPPPDLSTDESLPIQNLPPLDLSTPIPDEQGLQILESIWSDGKQGNGVKNALGHWNKHKSEFPELDNALDYTKKAQEFLSNPPDGALIRTRSHDGATIIYDPQTENFGVYRPDGTPKSFYKLDPSTHELPTNLDYFNDQK